jgi:hypothetical protein
MVNNVIESNEIIGTQNLNEMVDEKVLVATPNAVESNSAVATAGVEYTNEQSCCPKGKTTVVALIDGV